MSKSTRTPLKSTKRPKLLLLRLPRKSRRRNQLRTTRLTLRRMRMTRSLLMTNPPLRTRRKTRLNPKHLRKKLQHPKPRLTISDFVATNCEVICKVSWRNLKL
jgi:hypothetical protein